MKNQNIEKYGENQLDILLWASSDRSYVENVIGTKIFVT
jgi:hypothetical protein